MCFLLYLYHWALKLHKEQVFNFSVYIREIYLPALLGIGLEILLELIYIFFISAIFLNKFMSYYFFK